MEQPVRPQSIGPYEITGTVGAGGMGVVYRAVHCRTGQLAALKTVVGAEGEMLAGLRREIRAIERLRHPGVVRIYEHGVERGLPWYAMELVDGQPLLDCLPASKWRDATRDEMEETERNPPRRKLPDNFRQLLTLACRLCRTLAYVHGKGIVHRDLKPENVMVRRDGTPLLMDFGLVAQFRVAGRETVASESMAVGTASYLSPEQAAGQLVDARADLYTFGIMLYEIVSGRLPFTSWSVQEILKQHLYEPPPPLSRFVEDCPPRLEELILRLLEKDPADRYGYAADVARQLLELGAEPDPNEAPEETSSYLYRPRLEGRQQVLTELKRLVLAAGQGTGALVLIGGESGIGKTSVASAAAREADINFFTVVTGECLPVTASGGGHEIEAGPLHPLRPLLRAVADRCVVEGPAGRERLLGRRIETLREYEPSIAALEDPSAPHVRLTADVVQRRLVGDVVATITALADTTPLLLILDDLQWADEVTMKVLASLRAELFESRQLVVLGLYRSDETTPQLHALLARGDVRGHILPRLDDDSIGAIARAMLAARDLPDPFVHFLARQSEGNPFFVAEYLHASVSALLLYRESGRWRLRRADMADANLARTLGLPDSLRALVGRRLEMLSPAARRIVEAAAVLGRELEERALTQAAGEREDVAMDAIHELIERRVLEEVSGTALLRFVHDKLREVSYGGIDSGRRRTLHGAAARAIEDFSRDERELALRSHELGNHWEQAGDSARAIDYYEKAALSSLRTGSSAEAADLLQRILGLSDGSDGVRAALWHRLLSAARLGLGDLVASGRDAAEGMRRIGLPLPQTRSGWKRALASNIVRQIAHLVLPRRLYRARESDWKRLAEGALAAQRLAESGFFATDTVPMIACSLLSVNLAERCGAGANVPRVYAMLGLIAGICGTHRLADRYFREAIRESEHDAAGRAFAQVAKAMHTISIGRWEEARGACDASVRAAEITGDPQDMEIAVTVRGHIEFYTGAIAAARETYTGIRDGARKRANLQHMAWGHVGLARSLLHEGRFAEASSEARAAMEAMPDDHITNVVANAHASLAFLHQGDFEAARAHADRAAELVEKSLPTLFEMGLGYSNPCRTYLELRGRSRTAEEARALDEKVFRLCRGLGTLARQFPILRPTQVRLLALLFKQRGSQGKARRLLLRALDEATRLRMPVERALACLELSRLDSVSDTARRTYAEQAREILEDIGCWIYLDRADDGLAARIA